MCGFGVQEEKDNKKVVTKIHTVGCINRLQQYFESNLFTVGIVALCVAVTQLGGKHLLSSSAEIAKWKQEFILSCTFIFQEMIVSFSS